MQEDGALILILRLHMFTFCLLRTGFSKANENYRAFLIQEICPYPVLLKIRLNLGSNYVEDQKFRRL